LILVATEKNVDWTTQTKDKKGKEKEINSENLEGTKVNNKKRSTEGGDNW